MLGNYINSRWLFALRLRLHHRMLIGRCGPRWRPRASQHPSGSSAIDTPSVVCHVSPIPVIVLVKKKIGFFFVILSCRWRPTSKDSIFYGTLVAIFSCCWFWFVRGGSCFRKNENVFLDGVFCFCLFLFPVRRSSLGLKVPLVLLHVVFVGAVFLLYGDLIEKTKTEP